MRFGESFVGLERLQKARPRDLIISDEAIGPARGEPTARMIAEKFGSAIQMRQGRSRIPAREPRQPHTEVSPRISVPLDERPFEVMKRLVDIPIVEREHAERGKRIGMIVAPLRTGTREIGPTDIHCQNRGNCVQRRVAGMSLEERLEPLFRFVEPPEFMPQLEVEHGGLRQVHGRGIAERVEGAREVLR